MTDIRTSEEIGEIAEACAKAQAEVEHATKDAQNPHFKSRYASLPAVLDQVRPAFARQGIAIWQCPVNGEGSNIGIVTRLGHKSGQWIESTLYVAPLKFDAQGAGSVITYLRRYALMAIAGIGADDDDGNAAVARPDARTHGNGHAERPGARERERQWAAPEPAPVPGNGSGPHRIDRAQHRGWIGYGSALIAAINSAGTIAELAEWQHLNADGIAAMADAAEKPHRMVMAALDVARTRLAPLAPAEMG